MPLGGGLIVSYLFLVDCAIGEKRVMTCEICGRGAGSILGLVRMDPSWACEAQRASDAVTSKLGLKVTVPYGDVVDQCCVSGSRRW